MTAPANVTFRIRRYDPASRQPPAWEDLTIPYTHGMTVLDGLRVIKETRSATLAWRSSCRMGVRVLRHVHQRPSPPRMQHANH
jgi:succinate dehydrogenase/fumarate reductase-like Fe-S protein